MENKTAGGFNSSAASAADNVMNKAALGAHSAVDKAASLADEASRKAKPAIEKVAGYAHQAVDRRLELGLLVQGPIGRGQEQEHAGALAEARKIRVDPVQDLDRLPGRARDQLRA